MQTKTDSLYRTVGFCFNIVYNFLDVFIVILHILNIVDRKVLKTLDFFNIPS